MCNLALPRFVSSTAFAREALVSGPTYLLACGKPVVMEVFRNNAKSLWCGKLKSRRHGVDLQHVPQFYFGFLPESGRKDISNWHYRMHVFNKVALDLRYFLKSWTLADSQQQTLQKVQRLEAKNARLRFSQASDGSSEDGAPSPPPTGCCGRCVSFAHHATPALHLHPS